MTGDRDLLIESLWRDARREGDEIERAAAAEAGQARAAAEAQAGSARKSALERAAAEAAPEAARIVNRARAAAAGALLVRQKGILDLLLDEVAAQTAPGSLPESEAAAALPRLLEEALESAPKGAEGEAAVRPSDQKAAARILASAGSRLSLVTDPGIAGGVRLTLRGGREVLDNTLSARLANLRETPPLDLFAVLFPHPEKTPPGGEG